MGDSESESSLPNNYLLDTPRGPFDTMTTMPAAEQQQIHQSPSHFDHHHHHHTAVPDIYSDYIQDPYNMISFEQTQLQSERQQQQQSDVLAAFQSAASELQPSQQHASNVFQSSNYFGASASEQTTTKQSPDLFGLP